MAFWFVCFRDCILACVDVLGIAGAMPNTQREATQDDQEQDHTEHTENTDKDPFLKRFRRRSVHSLLILGHIVYLQVLFCCVFFVCFWLLFMLSVSVCLCRCAFA